MQSLKMPSLKRYVAGLAALAALTMLGACADEQQTTDSPTPDAAETSETPEPSEGSTDDESPLLDWESTIAEVGNARVELSRGDNNSVMLAGPTGRILKFPKNQRIADLLLDDEWAVVVVQDPKEQEPESAQVLPLPDGPPGFVVGPDSDLPTTNGGTWSLGEGTLFYATYQPKNTYCLAAFDLATQVAEVAGCVADDEGFNDARATSAGLTMLTFKLGKDGCRTPVTLENGEVTPLPGITECVGWDSLVTPGGTIWSEIPDPNRIEEATFFATADGEATELGPGDTGSLTWCGSAAYFTQQPTTDGEPARLLRWREGTLDVVYETPGSPGFISEPRCGGSRITISSESEGGDELVTAAID